MLFVRLLLLYPLLIDGVKRGRLTVYVANSECSGYPSSSLLLALMMVLLVVALRCRLYVLALATVVSPWVWRLMAEMSAPLFCMAFGMLRPNDPTHPKLSRTTRKPSAWRQWLMLVPSRGCSECSVSPFGPGSTGLQPYRNSTSWSDWRCLTPLLALATSWWSFSLLLVLDPAPSSDGGYPIGGLGLCFGMEVQNTG